VYSNPGWVPKVKGGVLIWRVKGLLTPSLDKVFGREPCSGIWLHPSAQKLQRDPGYRVDWKDECFQFFFNETYIPSALRHWQKYNIAPMNSVLHFGRNSVKKKYALKDVVTGSMVDHPTLCKRCDCSIESLVYCSWKRNLRNNDQGCA
jgi:hypothetical protein